ncbi:uncharacterized protein [Medicago truncatula]|uniref:NLI interacting factor-like phosphatase n=1 Tax=Medicago truncatula TaxID=3880 RepID=G7IIZ7_MEDTR|nr:uncharacterized protein LOC11423844 [Medicago truncatula]AES66023.1 NLI interacting factor-like phosphatase [Medicago truncatula]
MGPKRRGRKTSRKVQSDANGCGTQENTISSKASTSVSDMPSEHPIQCKSTDALMSQSCVEADICMPKNKEKEQNILCQATGKDNGRSDIQDKVKDSSVVADTEVLAKVSALEAVKMNIEQSINEKSSNPDETGDSMKNGSLVKNQDDDVEVHDLSGSQNNLDVKFTKKSKKRKRRKTKNNVVESDANGCGTPENTFPSKTSTSALDMPIEHPIQCLSTDALMSPPCVQADICLRGNEEEGQNILSQSAEKGNGESDIKDEGGNCSSVVADAELFAKESVLEVVQMDMEQSINQNGSNPKETSDSLNNKSLTMNNDEDLEVHDLSDKSDCIKTYSRKNLNNVHCIKEPPIQDHHNDDSHEVSDGPLTDGLMERETEHSTNQNKVEAEEMELTAENSSEQRSTTTSCLVDIPVTPLQEINASQVDHAEVTRNGGNSEISQCSVERPTSCLVDIPVTPLVETNARQVDHAEATRNGGNSKISQCSVERPIISNSKNKLLILDVNGLLADCVSDVPNGYYQPEPDFWVRRRKVYKRPFCDDFLRFCFDRFHVGIWSSRAKCNVDDVIKHLMGKSASRLLFCWNQSHCTTTKFSTVENKEKPLVLKELRKLWEKLEPGLPWEKGEFHESNTLLVDDSPYKALVNPMHTAIFPYSYRYHYTKDSSLGPKGDLRGYLERLAMADNVQEFVSRNEFGQRPIRPANPSWGYYLKVIESVQENDIPSAPDGGANCLKKKVG